MSRIGARCPVDRDRDRDEDEDGDGDGDRDGDGDGDGGKDEDHDRDNTFEELDGAHFREINDLHAVLIGEGHHHKQ